MLKKGTEPGNETSPSGPRSAGPSTDEMGRLIEMENRVMGLEERLASALDEVQEARSRAMDLMIMMREVIVHLAAMEKGESII